MTSYEPSRARPSGRRPTAAIAVGVALAVLVLIAAVTSLRKGDDGGENATPTTAATTLDPGVTQPAGDGSTPLTSGGSSVPEGGSTTGPSAGTPTPGRPISAQERKAAGDRLIAATPIPGAVPKGDYRPVCGELLTEIEGVVPPSDVVGFIALLKRLDLPKLATLAPAGIRSSYAELADLIPAAQAAADRAGGYPAPEDLPAGFLASLGVVLNSFAQQCPGIG